MDEVQCWYLASCNSSTKIQHIQESFWFQLTVIKAITGDINLCKTRTNISSSLHCFLDDTCRIKHDSRLSSITCSLDWISCFGIPPRTRDGAASPLLRWKSPHVRVQHNRLFSSLRDFELNVRMTVLTNASINERVQSFLTYSAFFPSKQWQLCTR